MGSEFMASFVLVAGSFMLEKSVHGKFGFSAATAQEQSFIGE